MRTLIFCVVAALFAAVPMVVRAKRVAPVAVKPVTVGDIEFSAPSDRMACVVARDTKTGAGWWRQIYVVVTNPLLETDVQDVFINRLEAKDGALIIGNEAGGEFKLDPKTMGVEVVKGSLVVKRK